MQASLDNIHHSSIKKLFEKLCLVSKGYEKKQHAMEDLDKQLEKIKKTSSGRELPRDKDISKIKSRINEILESERKIASYKKSHTDHEKELTRKVAELERELGEVKRERDNALEENKRHIRELNTSLLSIKTRMNEFIEHKKARERRVRELENKIKKKVR